MKKVRITQLATLFFMVLFYLMIVYVTSFSTNVLASNDTIRIMPLGDSITAGYTDNPKWQHPFNFGYRSGLVKRLQQENIEFTLVGKSDEPFNKKFGELTKDSPFEPKFDLRTLKQNGHRGYGGWRIAQIEKNIAQWMQVDRPDMILLMIGINGINANSPKQLDALVEKIFSIDKNVRLIVAQITPKHKFNQALLDYNIYIRDSLITKYLTRGHSISSIDLYQHFLINKEDPRSIDENLLSNGINHPTNLIYDKIALTWFNEIKRLLTKEKVQ